MSDPSGGMHALTPGLACLRDIGVIAAIVLVPQLPLGR